MGGAREAAGKRMWSLRFITARRAQRPAQACTAWEGAANRGGASPHGPGVAAVEMPQA
jgi:hypothetical protein